MHARAHAMGVLEALGWIEERGEAVLDAADLRWVREARQRMGCKQFQDRLTHEERMRIIALGRRCMGAGK